MFLALPEQLAPHLLTQGSQRIQLLVVELRAAAYARFTDFRQPLRTMARCRDLLAGAGDGATAVQRFYPGHDPCQIVADGQIAAHQLVQSSYSMLPVIDRLQ